jgi:hypothetical protein
MRDFRDAKAMAKTLRAALAARDVKLSISESLELIAKTFGVADWNTLAAAIRTAQAGQAAEPARAPPPDPIPPPDMRRRQFFSPALEATLHRSVGLAESRKHSYTTLEHLLLALTEDADAVRVLEGCRADVAALKTSVVRYIDDELLTLVGKTEEPTAPTAGFHRVVQRAVIHIQSSGVSEVTGANILVAMFSERESHACLFLTEQGVTRYDAVNFMVRGIRKGDVAA